MPHGAPLQAPAAPLACKRSLQERLGIRAEQGVTAQTCYAGQTNGVVLRSRRHLLAQHVGELLALLEAEHRHTQLGKAS